MQPTTVMRRPQRASIWLECSGAGFRAPLLHPPRSHLARHRMLHPVRRPLLHPVRRPLPHLAWRPLPHPARRPLPHLGQRCPPHLRLGVHRHPLHLAHRLRLSPGPPTHLWLRCRCSPLVFHRRPPTRLPALLTVVIPAPPPPHAPRLLPSLTPTPPSTGWIAHNRCFMCGRGCFSPIRIGRIRVAVAVGGSTFAPPWRMVSLRQRPIVMARMPVDHSDVQAPPPSSVSGVGSYFDRPGRRWMTRGCTGCLSPLGRRRKLRKKSLV